MTRACEVVNISDRTKRTVEQTELPTQTYYEVMEDFRRIEQKYARYAVVAAYAKVKQVTPAAISDPDGLKKAIDAVLAKMLLGTKLALDDEVEILRKKIG